MEARIEDAEEVPFGIFNDEIRIEKKDLAEIKSSIESLMIMMKYQNSDIRKELGYLATKQESAEIKYELKESMKTLELKLYAFIVKSVVTTIGILTAIQPIFNLITKVG